MAKSPKAVPSPSHHAINGLIVALFAAAVPHMLYQPAWVGLMFILMIGWRLLHSFRGWPLPAASRWLRLLHSGAAALTIVMIFGQFGLTIGRDAGAALLTIMLAFKVVEIRSIRDFYLSCFLGFFLVITNFFYSQSVWMMLWMLLVVIFLTTCLIDINSSHERQTAFQRCKLAALMVLQAVPVMLFLFVLFPRISGPIWGLPQDAGSATTTTMTEQITLGELPPRGAQGTTGISDNIEMGKISQLIQSDEIAFRVRFDNNEIPPSSALYWRGPVLWHTDGTVWSPLSRQNRQRQTPDIVIRGEAIKYTMTLEPHDKKWLFALDFPTRQPAQLSTYFSAGGRLNSDNAIKQRTQYQLVSHTDYRFNADTDANLQAALQLPKDKHPRTREQAKSWQQQVDTPQQYINLVLDHFNRDGYVYSLTPPVLRGDTVDSFLFETREGFCEHYAASFTILMRAAGIPARIVTGYLGGDVNPVDDVLVVRQRDAHAWTEVWLPGQGWIRIDPTAAVSSQRIERGMSDILPAERKSPALLARSDAMVALWQQMKNNWQAFNTAWDMWVVAFNPDKQKQLLQKLGMNNPDWQKMTVLLALLLSLSGLTMLLVSLYRKQHPDPAVRLYQQFCRKLARQGVVRRDYEGAMDFAARAADHLPDYQLQITSIASLYSQLRYRHCDDDTLAELKRQLKQFQPRR
jgi:transglutaminase-like putative cysteine protease